MKLLLELANLGGSGVAASMLMLCIIGFERLTVMFRRSFCM